MFTSVRIKNYRSFGVSSGSVPISITLGNLTVIVGSNSSGKSNIIRALQFGTDPSVDGVTRSDFFIAVSAGKERKSPTIEIEITAIVGGAQHTIRCIASGTSLKGFTKEFEVNGVKYPIVSANAPPSAALIAALLPFSVFVAPTVRDVDYLNSALGLLPVATRSVVLQSTNTLRASLTSKLAEVCKELKLPLGVGGVSVSPAFTLESLLQNVRLNFNVNDGVELPIANLGQGHISQAILKLAQMRGGSSVTCIEEPEVHVHPSGIKGLVRTLKEAAAVPGQQVIVTTHSAEFINQLNFSELVSVKKQGQRSHVKQVIPSSIGFSSVHAAGLQHKIIRQDQRGAIFLSKRVLLVEGAYDRLVVDILDRDGAIGLIEFDVVVVDMGGKQQFPAYHSILDALDRPHALLIDKDMIVESTTTAGPAVGAFVTSGALKAGLTAAELAAMHTMAASTFRRRVEVISSTIATRGVAIAAHGHHDISDAIRECVLAADVGLRVAAYTALGGTAPAPTAAIVDPWLLSKINSKKMPMVEVVQAFPVNSFRRIVLQLRRVVRELS